MGCVRVGKGSAVLRAGPRALRMPTRNVWRRLEACKDAVRRRYGFMALVPGSALVLAGQMEHDRENFRLPLGCL